MVKRFSGTVLQMAMDTTICGNNSIEISGTRIEHSLYRNLGGCSVSHFRQGSTVMSDSKAAQSAMFLVGLLTIFEGISLPTLPKDIHFTLVLLNSFLH